MSQTHDTPPAKWPDALRIGFCGLGRIGRNGINGALKKHPFLKLVAVADALPERVEALKSDLGVPGYSTLRGLIDDPEVEVIVLATRSSDHAAMAIEVLQAGKDVLVEKPIAINLAETQSILQAAKTSSGRLFVRHNRRFDPPLLLAKDIIASGKLGAVCRVQFRIGSYNRRRDWQTLRAYGGGQLLNWGPHVVDWAMQLAGTPEGGIWSELRRIAAAGDAEDYVKIVFQGSFGAIVDIEIGGSAIAQTPWHIIGQYGTLEIDEKNARLRYYHPGGCDMVEADAGTPQAQAGFGNDEKLPWEEEAIPLDSIEKQDLWESLYRSVRHGDPYPVSSGQVLETMRLIDLVKQRSEFR